MIRVNLTDPEDWNAKYQSLIKTMSAFYEDDLTMSSFYEDDLTNHLDRILRHYHMTEYGPSGLSLYKNGTRNNSIYINPRNKFYEDLYGEGVIYFEYPKFLKPCHKNFGKYNEGWVENFCKSNRGRMNDIIIQKGKTYDHVLAYIDNTRFQRDGRLYIVLRTENSIVDAFSRL